MENQKMKIYIAGKVTGLDYGETFEKFLKAETKLQELGHETVNPMRIVPKDTPWEKAMEICLKELEQCTGIFLIDDWIRSRGAKIEVQRSIELGHQFYD